MSSPEYTEKVVVWLREVVRDGVTSKSTIVMIQHEIRATRLLQDAQVSVFLDSNGEVVAKYQTSLIVDIEWPASVQPPSDLLELRIKPRRLSADAEAYPDESSLRDLPPGSEEWRTAVSDLHPRAYLPWSDEEDDQLRKECAEGLTYREIAVIHQRRKGGISSRVAHLEIER